MRSSYIDSRLYSSFGRLALQDTNTFVHTSNSCFVDAESINSSKNSDDEGGSRASTTAALDRLKARLQQLLRTPLSNTRRSTVLYSVRHLPAPAAALPPNVCSDAPGPEGEKKTASPTSRPEACKGTRAALSRRSEPEEEPVGGEQQLQPTLCSPPHALPTPILPTRAQQPLQTAEDTSSPKEAPSLSADTNPEVKMPKSPTTKVPKALHERKRASTKLLRRRAAKRSRKDLSLMDMC